MTNETNVRTLPEYAARAKGYLKIEERRKLFELAGDVPDGGLILNIGIEYGASMVCLSAGRKTRPRPGQYGVGLFGIDIDCSKMIAPPDPSFDIWYNKEGHRHKRIRLFTTSSEDYLISEITAYRSSADEPLWYDLIFIDGDHGYRGVTVDTLFCGSLNVDGIVMFHDCYDWEEPDKPHRLVPGVMQAVDDWFIGIMKGDNNFIELPKVGTSRLFKRIK